MLLGQRGLEAPSHIHAEVASGLRDNLRRGVISPDFAASAHNESLVIPFRLFEYRPFGTRVWQLRENLTPYDAWYVALAEYLEEPFATLDGNLIRSPGPRCQFLTYQP